MLKHPLIQLQDKLSALPRPKTPRLQALILFSLGIACLTASAFLILAPFSNQKPEFRPLLNSSELSQIIDGYLLFDDKFTKKQAIKIAEQQDISQRFTLYRIRSKETSGEWGDFHLLVDRQTKAITPYHFPLSTQFRPSANEDCLIVSQIQTTYDLCPNKKP